MILILLSCEICKLSKNNYFEEHLWTSAAKLYLKRDSKTGFFFEFCELFKNTYFVKDLRTAGSVTRCPENCPRTSTPEESCPPDNCPLDEWSWTITPKIIAPCKLPLRKIVFLMICSYIIVPKKTAPKEHCPKDKLHTIYTFSQESEIVVL